MRLALHAATLLLGIRTALGAVKIPSRGGTHLPDIVPNKFIVEVEDVSSFHTRDLSKRAHEALYRTLKRQEVAFSIDEEFNEPGLFVGAALTIEDAEHATMLSQTPGIKAIRPVMKIAAPTPEFNKLGDAPVAPMGSPASHLMTGVDRLHAEGIKGKGVKIGIIDSGVDYKHPNLGGGLGEGFKFAGGYDFVGNDFNGSNEAKPSDDPLDECNGHGSHVAGIIGASGQNDWNVTGVAPEATLYMYRVFGCLGYVTDTLIISAMLRAVKDNVDIISISIGGRDGWTRATSSVVASRIAASGKVVSIAAGNDGISGAFYSYGPANGIDAISVGSVENPVFPLQTVNVIGIEREPIVYFSWLPFNVTEDLPLYATSNDTTVKDDACEELPENTPDLSKYLVLVRRGTCTFLKKVENLEKKGAKQALFYDNGQNFLGIVVGNFTGALVRAADGEFLVNQYVSGAPVKLNFPQKGGAIAFPSPWGGLMSNFSSYGPTNDFYFKPALSAPGGNILSTIPLEMDGGFAVVSGTSMATPFIAGAAALALSVRGVTPDNARAVRTLLETTAQYVPSGPGDGALLQTAIQQGAGLVNVYKAVHTTTLVSPGELILNDTANFKPVHKVLVNNTGDIGKTYAVKHVPAGTAMTIIKDTPFQSNGPVPLDKAAASVAVSPSTFTLAPHSSREITLVFTPPQGLDAARFPVYSGFVEIAEIREPGLEKEGEEEEDADEDEDEDDSSDSAVHVSYIGAATALRDVQVVDHTPLYFGEKMPFLTNSSGLVQHEPTNYTFSGNDSASIYWRQLFGTVLFRIDVVDANTTLKTTLNRRQQLASDDTAEIEDPHLFTFPSEEGLPGMLTEVRIAGPLVQLDYLPRNNDNPYDYGYNALSWIAPKFANGTKLIPGNYRLLLRALKVTGDPGREHDYESWLSPIIGVYPENQPEEPPKDKEPPEEPLEPEEPGEEEPPEEPKPEPEEPKAGAGSIIELGRRDLNFAWI